MVLWFWTPNLRIGRRIPGAKKATNNKSLVFCSWKSELLKSNCTQHENHGIPLLIYMLPTFFDGVGVISGCCGCCARGIPQRNTCIVRGEERVRSDCDAIS